MRSATSSRTAPVWVQVCAALAAIAAASLVLGVAVVTSSDAGQRHHEAGTAAVAQAVEARSVPSATTLDRRSAGDDGAPAADAVGGSPAAEPRGPEVEVADVAVEPPEIEASDVEVDDPPELPQPDAHEAFVADADAADETGETGEVHDHDRPDGGHPAAASEGGEGAPEPAEAGDSRDAARKRRAQRLAERFPAEAAAEQDDGPGGRRWALVVGVNDYQGGGVRDTFGSVPDARVLAELLTDHGWRDEHLLVLTDAEATGEMIRAGIEWLADRTDATSEVVVSFSGHLQHRAGVTALWPTDHDYLWADEVGDRFAEVDAARMWMSFQGCHAQGLRSPQLHRDGRVITYSSKTAEKSREDPDAGHSVQGRFLFAEALAAGRDDPAAETPSVQEAFRQAAPRTHKRTAGQQTPQIWDGLGEPFRLTPE